MESDLTHSPADILRSLLIDLGAGSEPDDEDDPKDRVWPVHAKSEPDDPDDCITTYSTSGTLDGQSPHDGSLWDRHSWQVRVRGRTHLSGYQKANKIRNLLAGVYWETVSVPDDAGTAETEYRVETVLPLSTVIDLGREQGSSRYLFTINGTMTIQPNP